MKVMREFWRATNVNRRMEGAEEGLERLSVIVDHLVDRANDSSTVCQNLCEVVDDLELKVKALLKDMNRLKPSGWSKVKRRKIVNEVVKEMKSSKLDKSEFSTVVSEAVPEEAPFILEDLEEKVVEYAGGAVKVILEDTAIAVESPSILTPEIGEIFVEVPHQFPTKKVETPAVVSVVTEPEETIEESEDSEPEPIHEPVFEEVRSASPVEKQERSVVEKVIELPVQQRFDITVFDDRFNEIWGEIDKIRDKLLKAERVEEEDNSDEKLEALELLIKNLSDKADFLAFNIESIESAIKQKGHILEIVQNGLADLQLTKADQDAVESELKLKANKKDLTSKVERDELEDALIDVMNRIDTVQQSISGHQMKIESILEEMQLDIDARLLTSEYKVLQEPIIRRLHTLMFAFKNVKAMLMNIVQQDASGVTKCISCSRPAELAGTRHKELDHPISPKDKSHDFDVNDLSPHDPGSSSGSSNSRTVLGFPESIARRESKVKKLPLIPGGVRRKGMEWKYTQEAEHSQQEFLASDRAKHGKMLPGDLEAGFEIDTTSLDNSGLDLKKSVSLNPPTVPLPRSCGGSHTLTDPLQRGLKFKLLRVGQDPVGEKVNLRGADGAYYSGASFDRNNRSKAATKLSTSSRKATFREDLEPSEKEIVLLPNVVSLALDPAMAQKSETSKTCYLNFPNDKNKPGTSSFNG